MTYRVKAAAAVVKIGGTERYLYKGNIVPEAATNAEHLAQIGLLEEVELLEVPEADSPEDLPPIPPVVPGGAEQPPTPPADAGDGVQLEVAPPPKAGQGSSAEAWRNYAVGLGVEVADDAPRDDVIAALEAAGKPTE